MNQSNVLMGALFVAFVIFITMRGKTKKYLDLLVGGGTSATAASDKAASSSSGGGGGGAASGAGGVLGAVGSALGIPSGVTSMVGGLFGGSGGGGGDSGGTPAEGGTAASGAPTFGLLGAEDIRFPSLPAEMRLDTYLTPFLQGASKMVKSGGDSIVGFYNEIPTFFQMPDMGSGGSPLYGAGGAMYNGGGAMYDPTQPPGGMFSTSGFANPFFGGGAP